MTKKKYKVNILDKRYVPTLGRGPFHQVVLDSDFVNVLIYRGFSITLLDLNLDPTTPLTNDVKVAPTATITTGKSDLDLKDLITKSDLTKFTENLETQVKDMVDKSIEDNPLLQTLNASANLEFYNKLTKIAEEHDKEINDLVNKVKGIELDLEHLKIGSSRVRSVDFSKQPSMRWSTVNLFPGKPVNVECISTTGEELIGSVEIIGDWAEVTVTFSRPVDGYMIFTSID